MTRVLAALAAIACLAIARASLAARVGVNGVRSIAMTVSDIGRAEAFYERVLTFRPVADVIAVADNSRRRVVTMQLGDELVELVEYLGQPARPIPADSRSNDRWFQHIAIVVTDMDRAYAQLRANHVTPTSTAPQRLPASNTAAGGIVAYYFKDPDAHPLELLQFPRDKGLPKWHHPTDRLFLGIDHTAIVVGRTAGSVEFYSNLLGLSIAGESDNFGVEQERLSHVRGAHLHITTLRGMNGPGVELLEYLMPRDGRAFPSDERTSDVVDEATVMFSAAARALARQITAAGVSIAAASDSPTKWRLHDPDGHPIEIDQP